MAEIDAGSNPDAQRRPHALICGGVRSSQEAIDRPELGIRGGHFVRLASLGGDQQRRAAWSLGSIDADASRNETRGPANAGPRFHLTYEDCLASITPRSTKQ